MENSLAVPQKATLRITVQLSNSTPRSIPKRMENRDSNRYLYASIHCSILHNSRKMATSQVSSNKWFNKVLYDGILLIHTNEWSSGQHMNELWKPLLSSISQTPKDKYIWSHLFERCSIGRFIGTESGLEVTIYSGMGSYCSGVEFLSGVLKKLPEWWLQNGVNIINTNEWIAVQKWLQQWVLGYGYFATTKTKTNWTLVHPTSLPVLTPPTLLSAGLSSCLPVETPFHSLDPSQGAPPSLRTSLTHCPSICSQINMTFNLLELSE